MTPWIYALAAVFGAAIGSFLNVCIVRIPEGKSIIFPPSHCLQCGQPIRFYDNIPIVSYIFLKGKCRSCRQKISLRYPLVEFLTAFMAVILLWKFGVSVKYLFSFLFVCVLIVIAFIDLDHQIIPDIITLPGIPICFAVAVLFMDITLFEAALGLLIGGGSLYLVAFLYELITKREGMGGGDIKLLAMLGAFWGWKSLLFILLLSSFSGAFVGICLMILKGKNMKYAVPFGPFLSLAGVVYIFLGDAFMRFFIFRY
jgi:leader peptidase (prepilin peptidase)/N-methyltransferase